MQSFFMHFGFLFAKAIAGIVVHKLHQAAGIFQFKFFQDIMTVHFYCFQRDIHPAGNFPGGKSLF